MAHIQLPQLQNPFVSTVPAEYTHTVEMLPYVHRAIASQCLFLVKVLQNVFQETRPSDPVRIGLIGCGFVGSQIVHLLLDFGIQPHQIKVSTRTTAAVADGVDVVSDNVGIARMADILILAVPPVQLTAIGADLRGNLTPNVLVLSLLAGVTMQKVCMVLKSPFAICSVVNMGALKEYCVTEATAKWRTCLRDVADIKQMTPERLCAYCPVEMNSDYVFELLLAVSTATSLAPSVDETHRLRCARALLGELSGATLAALSDSVEKAIKSATDEAVMKLLVEGVKHHNIAEAVCHAFRAQYVTYLRQ
eukprot:TRINITY_DN1686_c0_g1_i1.p2 TRINITY_DN1686_c0_g1~~TRINITY_DN1686_c0_g1_i1.p2  ORF type:complete len:306 (+),score=56.96 TRINITY_DN1686_c0_g1_i1:2309-3226(+)